MSTNLAVKLLPEPVRSLAHGSIGAGYMGIGTAILYPSRLLLVSNLTDADLMFSWDGVNDAYPVAARSYIIIDCTANRTDTGGSLCIMQGTRFYAKEIGAPSSGSIYVTSFYGANG